MMAFHLKDATRRDCNGCNICCVAPAIMGDDVVLPLTKPKPACQKCEFSGNGGCSVYAQRPPVCRDYSCLWLEGVVDMDPMEYEVAWALVPGDESQEDSWVFVGHALDVDKLWKMGTTGEKKLVKLLVFVFETLVKNQDTQVVIIRDTKGAHMLQRVLREPTETGAKVHIYARKAPINPLDPCQAIAQADKLERSPYSFTYDVEYSNPNPAPKA